ncbi:PKD domain-containing protein [Candidatus Bipolaricaulota bacterium]
MAAWTAVGLLAFGLSCWGTVAVAVRSADQEAAPGAFVTPVFAVANLGATELTALLELEAPSGWQILGAQGSLFILPGEEGSVFATIVIPSDAPAGDYELALTAAAESDPDDRSTAVARIRVEPTSIVELTGPIGSSAGPGLAVEYELTLANRGTVQDSIVVTATSSHPLDVELSPSVLDLAPQETATIRIALRVPIAAESGQDVLTVTAVSLIYDGVQDEAVINTTILPPTPDAVRGTTMEILPARLRLSLDKDVFTGTLGSRLTFSTSGRVLDGFFSSFVSTTDPFGPDPFEVTSYSILYRRKPTMTRLGNVSTRLTDLVSVSCEGGSFDIDEELFDLIFVGGVHDDEARFGGRFALGPEVANVGLTYFEARDQMSRRAIASATTEAEPIEDWRILAEAALGTDDGISSRAFLFGTEIDVEGYFLDGEVFSVGTDFPGSDRDSAGIRLSQRLRMTDLSLSLSLSHEWDNVVRNPLLPTVIDDQLGFNIRANPIEDGPTLTSTAEFGWRREDDPTHMSDVDLLLAMGLRETGGVFPYTFSGEISDRIDLALGTHNRTLTFSEGAGLSVDSFYLFLQLTQEKRVDIINDLVLSGETDVSILFRPEGTLHEASISLKNTLDSFSLSTSLFIRFLEDLDIVFDGSIAWDRADASPISFGWGVTFNMDLNVPLPFLVTKGRIEGRLFVDVDGDGVYGSADRPIGGAIVEANGSAVSTDEDGLFRFPPLRQGTYSVDIRETPPDAASPDPVAVRVTAGELSTVPIPLAPILTIDGLVFEDLDQDGSAGVDESGFTDVRVLLLREDGAVFSALTDATGAFSFVDVLPGEYTASLDPATLPARFAFTTKESVVVEPTAAAPSVISFGGYIRPRPVIVAVQPPTADFSVSPEEPIAGEPATFDASLSLDFDGEIAAYAWDFDGDGEEDAIVPTSEWTFPSPGAYEVSLTVTDDTGNKDTLTRTINVGGTGPTTDVILVSSIQPPIAGFSFSPEAPEPGEAVAFDGNLSVDFDGEITAYEWDFDGDGVTDATGPTALRVFSATGSYDVRLSVTDDGRNKDTIAQTVEVAPRSTIPIDVRPTLQPPTAGFSYTPGQPVDGEPVTFDASPSSDPDGEIASYAWDFDGDGVVDSTDPIVGHVFPTPGTYAVRLTVLDHDDAADTATYEVSVGDSSPAEDVDGTILPPIADFTFAPEAPVAGEPIEFNGLVSFDFDGAVVEFEWDFDSNGVIDASGSIVLHVFAAPGTYKTRLTVTDNDGATDAIVRSIDVE